jgi:hypothetical protein
MEYSKGVSTSQGGQKLTVLIKFDYKVVKLDLPRLWVIKYICRGRQERQSGACQLNVTNFGKKKKKNKLSFYLKMVLFMWECRPLEVAEFQILNTIIWLFLVLPP